MPIEDESPSDDGKKLIISVEISKDDAARLLKAFEDGLLAQFGVTSMALTAPASLESPTKKWSANERRRDSSESPNKTGRNT